MKKIFILFIVSLSFFCMSCGDENAISTATEMDYPRVLGEFPGFDSQNNRPGSLSVTLIPGGDNTYLFNVQFVPAQSAEGIWYVGAKIAGGIKGDTDFDGLRIAEYEVYSGPNYQLDYSTWATGVYPMELVVSTKTDTTYRRCYIVVSNSIQ